MVSYALPASCPSGAAWCGAGGGRRARHRTDGCKLWHEQRAARRHWRTRAHLCGRHPADYQSTGGGQSGSARERQAAGAEFTGPHLAHATARPIRCACALPAVRVRTAPIRGAAARPEETLLIEWRHSRDSRFQSGFAPVVHGTSDPSSVKLPYPGHVPARSTAVHIAEETPGHSFGHSFRRTEREQTQTNLTKKC